MKTALTLAAMFMLFSNSAFAAFECRVWNNPIGSGDTFDFQLKPISQSEPYMLEGEIHGLNLTALLNQAGTYSITAAQPNQGERGFYLKTEVPFGPDSQVTFNYPVEALNDIIQLNIQCTK